ncbi:MAG: GDP-L-fucose synthase [Candidatus Omnitrophica bacterium]|nr:GDP-L-fucose synthase [Candidatus Omnitrophota bacterium]MDE2232399.1 GDP-L-fucose synthase [Candidatus Omnitrophota bacterium]
MRCNSRIFIVGHNDSIENSLTNYFQARGFRHVISNTRDRVDVLDQLQVEKFFSHFKPEYIFLGSVRSGGIAANQKMPAEFIYENLQAQNLVIDAARRHKVKKLLYFSSSCVYPVQARQPIKEASLLTGTLEPTSEPYAVAKIAGMKMCRAYRAQYGFNAITAVPATLYGPGSDTDMESAHVLGALIAKFHKALAERRDKVVVWGSGRPRREFLYVDDFVSACLFLMEKYDGADAVNVGTGRDVTIKELAAMIKRASGFKGRITFDISKPDGVARKLLDSNRLRRLGFKPKVSLEEGIKKTYQWYNIKH